MYVHTCALVCMHACTRACVRAWKPKCPCAFEIVLPQMLMTHSHRLMQAFAARMEKNHVHVYVCAGVRACVYACKRACLEAQCPCAFEIITSQMVMTHFHRSMQALAARMEKNHVRVCVCVGVRACVYACVCACLENQSPCAFGIIFLKC